MKLFLPMLIFLSLGINAQYVVKDEETILAVVTHKAGLASGLAHNHVIQSSLFYTQLNYDGTAANTKLVAKIVTKNLEPDLPELQKKLYPTLKKLNVLTEEPSVVSESDRAEIKENMLSSGQLNAEKYPAITMELVKVSQKDKKVGEVKFAYELEVAVTICGKKKNVLFAANITETDEKLNVEAVAEAKFTDFGITPYSALLGALRNDDQIHFYANIVAAKSKRRPKK